MREHRCPSVPCCSSGGLLLVADRRSDSDTHRPAPLKWADVMRSLLPETQAYIATASSQRNKSSGV